MTVSVVNGSRSPWNFLYNILWIFLLFFFPPLMVRYSKKHRQKLARLREEQLRKDEKS